MLFLRCLLNSECTRELLKLRGCNCDCWCRAEIHREKLLWKPMSCYNLPVFLLSQCSWFHCSCCSRGWKGDLLCLIFFLCWKMKKIWWCFDNSWKASEKLFYEWTTWYLLLIHGCIFIQFHGVWSLMTFDEGTIFAELKLVFSIIFCCFVSNVEFLFPGFVVAAETLCFEACLNEILLTS